VFGGGLSEWCAVGEPPHSLSPSPSPHPHVRRVSCGVADRVAMVRQLLEHGADVRAVDGDGWTPLGAAVAQVPCRSRAVHSGDLDARGGGLKCR
jgi:hypothetical protein